MASQPPFETNFSAIFGSSCPRSISDDKNIAKPTVQTTGSVKLPVIDLSHLTNGDEVKRKRYVKQLVEAAKEWGFFEIVNHGIPKEFFEMMFHEEKKLFDRSFSQKVQEKFSDLSKNCYRWGNPNATSPAQYSFSEAFHITLAEISSFSDGSNNFRTTVAMYAQEIARVAQMICEILGNEVNVNSKYFENIWELKNSFLRLNKYHPRVFGTEVFGLVPHTDTSFITMLSQDQIEGLELRKNGQWIGVKPCPEALTVNIGDMFQALSNGVYQSVRHRVISPVNRERLSIAFFVCPYLETEIECYGNLKKYRRFSFREYKEQSERDVKETGDKPVRNQGSMFESGFKINCEIIESGWAKDRALVDTFIVGLASNIRQKNDYEEQVDREKEVSTVQLLAELLHYSELKNRRTWIMKKKEKKK